jgi:hypothetical protein
MKHLSLSFLLLVFLGPGISLATADSPQRIDVSPKFDRRDHLSRNWQNWLAAPDQDANFELNGVEFSIQGAGDEPAPLKADWWKGGLDHDAAMASDGVYVEGDQAGLIITIRGLAPGEHSLVTYHNSIWNDPLVPVDISVKGRPWISALQPSTKATDDADAASGYLEFVAQEGKDVVIEIKPSLEKPRRRNQEHLNRVILNGLELDTADPTKKSVKPNPATGDEHVAERPELSWQGAKSVMGHDVYVGTDRDAVANATPSSPEYKGRQSTTNFQSDADDPSATYYWRVDEVASVVPQSIMKGNVWSFRIRQLAFPGAEGYGRFARGGRGGRVIEVTNLNDSGPGSLRAAVEAEGPRTVVFNVSGLISLESKLIIRNPYLTIAGQTAPGKGICIRKYNMGMGGTHDVIIRYVRVRPGNIAGVTLDGMGMAGTDHSIIDHCSISWTQDEAFSSRGAKNITLQRTLISEALNIAGHKNYEKGKQHGYAASIGGDVGSFHHNLLAHCAGRNWSLAGGLDKGGIHTGRLDIRNNVVYNWAHRTTDGGVMQLNFVNNYYKPGPASRVFHVLMPERNHQFGPQDYYVKGNIMKGRYGANERYAGVLAPRNEAMENFIVNEPFFEPFVKTQSAKAALRDVLADVGCNVPMLDDHDRRVIEETRKTTTTYQGSVSGLPGLPDSQEDVGGWEDYPEIERPADWDSDHDGLPDNWETSHGLNPNSPPGDYADSNGDPDGDGFTNLEDYLNSLASSGRKRT